MKLDLSSNERFLTDIVIVLINCVFVIISASPNTDGVDPDSTHNMIIEHCYINVGDDFVAVKSGLNQWGLAVNISTQNLTIR